MSERECGPKDVRGRDAEPLSVRGEKGTPSDLTREGRGTRFHGDGRGLVGDGGQGGGESTEKARRLNSITKVTGSQLSRNLLLSPFNSQFHRRAAHREFFSTRVVDAVSFDSPTL